MEDIQTGNVTECLYCKQSIMEVVDPISGVIDWGDIGDFGCGENPINSSEGTGSHHPSTMFRQAGYRLSGEELLKILTDQKVSFGDPMDVIHTKEKPIWDILEDVFDSLKMAGCPEQVFNEVRDYVVNYYDEGDMLTSASANVKFRDTFTTPFEQHRHLEGHSFRVTEVINQPDETHDEEVLPMYEIEFRDGQRIQAWPEEVEAK